MVASDNVMLALKGLLYCVRAANARVRGVPLSLPPDALPLLFAPPLKLVAQDPADQADPNFVPCWSDMGLLLGHSVPAYLGIINPELRRFGIDTIPVPSSVKELAAGQGVLEYSRREYLAAVGAPDSRERGVKLRQLAEILQNGDLGATEVMLKRWNGKKLPKPKAIGRSPSDRRAKLYRPTEIVAWAEKVEGYLTVPKDELIQRLMTLAVPPMAE